MNLGFRSEGETYMRALITGINGFTGRYMAAELMQHGYEVFGLGGQVECDLPNYQTVDLLDAESLKRAVSKVRPQIVVHLAAIAFVAHGNPETFYHVNLLGTRNLLEALGSLGKSPECVLLASSANVYGNTATGMLSELMSPNPANDYAVSKLAMEYMARLWMDRLPIVLARPFNYTGVGQSENFLLPKIVSHFSRRNKTIELGNLDVWRDFGDVRAVASAYRQLLGAHAAGQTINICSGKTYSLREIITIAESITGHNIDVQINPAFVRANEVRSLSGDPSLLKSLIGDWNSPPIEETLRWMLHAQ
jgi:nucleoside-diphosphate-sugar epimerase